MTTKPATYTITRKKTSKPDGPMRVIIQAAPAAGGNDAGLGEGGTYYFSPGESHPIPGHLAADFMADAYHAEHFDVDPALPQRTLRQAEKADEARVEVAGEPPVNPADVGAAGAAGGPKKTTTRAK